MRYARMPIEIESPEEFGYGQIRFNLSESSVADRSLSDLGLAVPDLKLLYGEHRGSPVARAALAADAPNLTADDVLITSGAAAALFIVATSLLGPSDHLVVVRPNYATNLETPRAIGCAVTHVDLDFASGFRIDPEAIAAALRPETRIVSVTCPHNPSGAMMTEEDLRQLVALTARQDCLLLVDETYRDLSFDGPLPLAASLGNHVIGVSSLSKAYGVPGIRFGWIIARDPVLQELFLAAKEQISICGSVIDEWIGEQVVLARSRLLPSILDEMRRRREIVRTWIAAEPLLEWVPPAGGVVCFPRMITEPPGGTDAFYRRLIEDHGCYVGPGHWFERPDSHFRLGYGWPTRDELESGLAAISAALRG